MQVGMIGLGRMGASLARRLANDGHACVVYDMNADTVRTAANDFIEGHLSLEAVGQSHNEHAEVHQVGDH